MFSINLTYEGDYRHFCYLFLSAKIATFLATLRCALQWRSHGGDRGRVPPPAYKVGF